MKETYTVEVEYNTQGIPYVEYPADAKLSAIHHGNTYTIYGNSAGLLFLARNLVALAQMPALQELEGYHIHIDDLYNINKKEIEFILRLENNIEDSNL